MRGRDGRLGVHLPSGDGVSCRAERWPGGPWDAPRKVGGGQKLCPVLAVGQGPDRYAHLVSWRPTAPGEAGLVHSTHFRPRLSAPDWTPVGHPGRKGDRTGTPAGRATAPAPRPWPSTPGDAPMSSSATRAAE